MKTIILVLTCLVAISSHADKSKNSDLRTSKSFIESCPEEFLTYIDKSEGGAGAYCNCPDENISYIDKSEGGSGAYCKATAKSEVQVFRLGIKSNEMDASKCKSNVEAIAKMNMDQKAKSYSFDESAIDEAVFEKSVSEDNEKLYIFNVGAFIYKGNYNVKVSVDSSCSVESVKITEILRDATAVAE